MGLASACDLYLTRTIKNATIARAPAGAKYLAAFVEEMKAQGFVAEALKRSGQTAKVAPPAM